MFKRILIFLLVIVIVCIAGVFAAALYINWPVDHETVELRIEPGTSVRAITKELSDNNIIKCERCFRAYVVVSNAASKLRAGDYEFESGLTPKDVLVKLLDGDFKTHQFTIPEGWRVTEIAEYISKLPFVENPNIKEEFIRLANDKEYINSLGFDWEVASLEGYLFPSTYRIYKITDAREIISKMVDEFRNRFSEKVQQGANKAGLKPEEVIILASIVEKETGKDEERPLVASVFANRIKINMALQSDPTIIYGLKNFDGNIRKRDISNPHLYNTYVHPGLPPGPISNPGEASIDAVLNPANTDYLFFVSKNDGSHIFSKNYNDHVRAVRKYQRGQ